MLRVCMVSDHGCIRVFKEACALMKQGVLVDVLAYRAPFGYNTFTTAGLWLDRDQLKRSVEASPADIFHVHNEPDWLVAAVREATAKPVVYDVHDLQSLGADSDPDDDENRAFEAADAIVHVSLPCAQKAVSYHGNAKPSLILPSYVNEQFIPQQVTDVSWHSVAYEGGLSSDGAISQNGDKKWMNMRYWVPLVKEFIDQGWNVALFCASSEPGIAYEDIGAFVARNVHYPNLLRALRPHAFGLVGALRSFPLIHAALPNKLFEYISQGVVPVVFNADESARFVKEHGIGIVPEKGDDRTVELQLVDEGQRARQRLLELRGEFTMERQIGRLLDLYEEVL